jgi:hypothetical protein
MLPLAATNLVGVVLFAALYATAGVRFMSQAAFLGCLVVIFALVTALWVRVEARHRTIEPLRRLGRGAGGLAAVMVVVPALVLMPAFWLDSQLPAETGFARYLAPIMTLVLIALVLVVLVNVLGAVVVVGREMLGRRR